MTWSVIAIAIAAGSTAFGQNPQNPYPQTERPEPGRPARPEVSEAEAEALKKIEKAPDAAGKLKMSEEFMKKYAKSSMRERVAGHVMEEIARIPDAAQQITLGEVYRTVFIDPKAHDLIDPLLMDAYIRGKRLDDAFKLAETYFGRQPEDVRALTQMSLIGVEQVKQNNPKFLQQSQEYAGRAIALIEGDKMPPTLTAAQWGEYRTKWLAQLYQGSGFLQLVTGNRSEAKLKLDKAASINQHDPVTHLLIGSIANDDYQQLAKEHKAMLEGPEQDEVLRKAHAKLDEVIEIYARVVGTSEGNPQYKMLHDQILQDLENYFKYRHNGSTDGLQKLIDKYKKTP